MGKYHIDCLDGCWRLKELDADRDPVKALKLVEAALEKVVEEHTPGLDYSATERAMFEHCRTALAAIRGREEMP